MISPLLLLTVAVVDIVMGIAGMPEPRTGKNAPSIPVRVVWLGMLVAVALPAAGWLVLAAPLPAAVAIAFFAAVWIWQECRFIRRAANAWFIAAALALVVAVVIGVFTEAGERAVSPLVTDYSDYAKSIGLPLAPELLVGAVAVVLILTRTANLICRAALGRTVVMEPSAPSGPRRWTVSIRSRELASVAEDDTLRAASVGDAATTLKGGRVIGPLERILITALALAGAEAVIVGLLAAKGIVRFPEISADERRGSKAEEFLVGSLVSWTIAGLAAAYLATLQNGL
ncbi:hypothetical protein WDJ51_09690 [Rathayibacter sp. YIM 133350]|uniref:hypothetical protein n=1 Tax=Rathayibacter sp. YIM 133350 TaxID=3131992 RepID=UPI00307F1995